MIQVILNVNSTKKRKDLFLYSLKKVNSSRVPNGI